MVLAKTGYALAGLNVVENGKIVGIQPIFMKRAGKSFASSDRYVGLWYGLEHNDEPFITLATMDVRFSAFG